MTAYVSAAEIRAAMPDVFPDNSHDTTLDSLAERASRLIDGLLGWDANAFAVAESATIRYYNGLGGDYAFIEPCIEISAVAVKSAATASDYDAWDETDYWAGAGSPSGPDWNAGYYTLLMVPPGDGQRFTYGPKTVKVTARWGATESPPAEIEQAVTIQTARWFRRGQSAFADTMANAELGMMEYTQKLDPDIKTLLLGSKYRRLR